MINDYTASTAAEEPDVSPKNSDQNFEENSSKLMNLEDSNGVLDNEDGQENPDGDSNERLRKRQPYKHILNNHDLRSILPGKRSRRPVEPSEEGKKSGRTLRYHDLRQDPEEPPRRGHSRFQGSKLQAKTKAKGDRKLNKIFGKSSAYEEPVEAAVDTKEVFDNYYQKVKRKVEFNISDELEKVIPEKRRVIETAIPYFEEEKNGLQKEKGREDLPFLNDRNLMQKTRDFENIKMLGTKILNFPRAQPTLLNPQNQLDKLEEIRKKLEEAPKKIVKRTGKKAVSVNDVAQTRNSKAKEIANHTNYIHAQTYINCDLRYFNFDFLVEKLGYFDVILMDPPWRIKQQKLLPPQAQNSQLPEIPANRKKANLDFDTMSNKEIMNLRVDKLSRKGFVFFWIQADELNIAYEMMSNWGYEVVDQIIWVKLQEKKVHLSQGDYFMHSFEMCLLGYKCPPGEHVEYNSKVSNNIVFADVRYKFQKPEELYEIIDLMMPGAKKIELFARNHNLRPGWFSLGNQLGEEFDKWYNLIGCNNCTNSISIGVKRYKAKRQPNYDLCENCFQNLELEKEDFFEMNNLVEEDVLHHYHSCKKCHSDPIWGTRFTCLDCENFDLCEACYDANLQSDVKFHDVNHNFVGIEIPVHSNTLPSHFDKKCAACCQKPIIGVSFGCVQCPNLNLCQNCYFVKTPEEMKNFEGHKPFHHFTISAEPSDLESSSSYKCSWCEVSPIQGTTYKCEGCFNFYFCEKCYFKKDSFKLNTSHSHKFYHNFIPVSQSE